MFIKLIYLRRFFLPALRVPFTIDLDIFLKLFPLFFLARAMYAPRFFFLVACELLLMLTILPALFCLRFFLVRCFLPCCVLYAVRFQTWRLEPTRASNVPAPLTITLPLLNRFQFFPIIYN
jgi:hypothetical protein